MTLLNVARYLVGIALGLCIAMALQDLSPTHVHNPIASYLWNF